MMGSIKKGNSIQRSGARNEDDIYVSGDLGTAALCLKKMNEGIEPSLNELNKLNRPIPRLELGASIKDLASSCIDVSDGLEQDLSHILKSSEVGATIDVNKLPLGEALSQYIKETNDWSLPLSGGDDYELCFTADKASSSKLQRLSETLNIRVTKIGSINATNELKINGYDGPRTSYQHF